MAKLRVLFIIRTLLRAGAERLVVNISNELVAKDYAEVAIYLVDGGNEFQGILDSRVQVLGGDVSLRFSPYKKNKFNIDSYKAFVESFRPNIIHSHLYFGDLLAHSWYYKDAVYFSHQHNSKVQEYSGIYLKGICSKRMWTDYYEFSWLKKKMKLHDTELIACSRGTYDMISRKIDFAKSHLFPNAIPLPSQEFLRVPKTRNTHNLIWVGRFSDAKRPFLAIEVAKLLKERNFPFTLNMFGIGIHFDECQNLIDKYGLQQVVHLNGLVADMEPYYEEATLMLHTAVYEGMPMVFIEANAYGIPIITSDCMPNNDFIKERVNGIVIKSEAPEIYADCIQELLQSEQFFLALSKGALQVANTFDIQQYTNKLLVLYQSKLRSID